MLDISTLVREAMARAHATLCTDDPEKCSGPTEIEALITAYTMEATVPRIMSAISLEFKQALHSMAAGYLDPGDDDALAVDPLQLLATWLSWYEGGIGNLPPNQVHVKTKAYLAAVSVQAG